MRENDRTSAAVASSGKIVPLQQADAPHGQDHLTWAYQTHVTAIYQYIYNRVGNRPDAEDLTAQVFTKAINGMRRGPRPGPRGSSNASPTPRPAPAMTIAARGRM